MNIRRSLINGLVLAVLAGCGNEPDVVVSQHETGGTTAVDDHPGGSDASETYGGSGDGTGGNGSGGGAGSGLIHFGDCSPDDICLKVNLLGSSAPDGRIAVIWHQLSEDGPDPEWSVAYDATFSPNSEVVGIPISEIALPNDANMYCDRDCDDEATCPCTSGFKVGFGLIVAHTGDIPSPESIFGVAWMSVNYSSHELTDPNDIGFQYMSIWFPEGLLMGIHPYRIIEEAGKHDKMGLAQDGQIFNLNVCAPDDASCDLEVPNIN